MQNNLNSYPNTLSVIVPNEFETMPHETDLSIDIKVLAEVEKIWITYDVD